MNGILRLLLVILLVLLIVGMLPVWPYSTGWSLGYYPSGGLFLALIVVLVVLALGSSGRGQPRL